MPLHIKKNIKKNIKKKRRPKTRSATVLSWTYKICMLDELPRLQTLNTEIAGSWAHSQRLRIAEIELVQKFLKNRKIGTK